MKTYLYTILCGIFVFVSMGRAQVAGTLDTAFDANVTATEVFAAVSQTDGKILLCGGTLTAVAGVARGNFARVNADGSLESTATFNLGTGADGRVNSISVQKDGKIIIVGDFATVAGQARSRIARLNADGSLESLATFNPGAGANALVRSCILQSDDKIILVGDFTTINGQPRNRIARLNSDGTLESTTTFDTGTGASARIYCAVVQPDGKIVIGGDFTSINGQSRIRIARLNANGSLESTATFNPGSGPNDFVLTMVLQPDGKILCGGQFITFNGISARRFARLESNGALESTTTFNPGTAFNDSVRSIILQTDGKIVLSGLFTNLNGLTSNRIARLQPNGAVESLTTFNAGSGLNNIVSGIGPQSDGKIVLVGQFTSMNGQFRGYAARMLNDPVVQILTVPSRARLQWLRGGASTEINQVSFEVSTDGGLNWALLGAGSRISGGWELTGLSLPTVGQIRARGRATSGYSNGSSGLMEAKKTFSFSLSAQETWRQANFGTSANTGNAADNADPDKDGMSNLVEYAFVLNPNLPDAQSLPQWELSDGEYLFAFPISPAVTGISYVAEYSSTLAPGSWLPATAISDPNYHYYYAPTTGQRTFLRVRVTVP